MSNGTTTNLDGEFSISLQNSNANVEISYIGYKTVTTKLHEGIVISLATDAELLDEVVVTGYMAERKADLTGSVTVVKLQAIAGVPTGNVLSSLHGIVAGVNIYNVCTSG